MQCFENFGGAIAPPGCASGTKGFFQNFSRGGGKSGEICFFPLKNKKTTIFC